MLYVLLTVDVISERVASELQCATFCHSGASTSTDRHGITWAIS